jgi:carbohydrate diacid regulator
MDTPVLTPELAAEIADETTRILGHNVLITDENANVIGSGDVARVGSTHEASVAVVASGHAESHNAEQAAALVGVLPGITMPIVLDGAVVGTVGITGAPDTVVKLGRLVQRQTEILLRESLFQRTRLLRENRLTQLVRDVVLFDPRLVEDRIVMASGAELGYDLTQPRVAVVFEAQPGPDTYRSSVRAIGEVFGSRMDIIAELSAGKYVVLHHLLTDENEGVVDRAFRAADLLHDRHGIVMHVGIGEAGHDVASLAVSYDDAAAALRIGCAGPGVHVCEIRDLRIRQLLDSTGAAARARFTRSQLNRLSSESDFTALRDTVIAWCESGFNLVVTAQRLAIHRNTVIYRLDKISRVTCRDARKPAVAIPLYLACIVGD